MPWIQTFTGRKFFPMSPRVEDIDIHDIAHSLSMQCRFNGHCREFYSVAQHSVLVSQAVPAEFALWGLLHDAAEAYVSDLPRPVKKQIPTFGEAEDRLLEVIVKHFGLAWPMPEAVREMDDALLMTECRDLMCPAPDSWRIDAMPLKQKIKPVSPGRAEKMFLKRFDALCDASLDT
jgi:uncharacterized protein